MPDKPAEPRRAALLIPLSVLTALVVIVGILLVSADGGGDGGGDAAEDAEVQRTADRLRAEFEARDARQIVDLTETARRARGDLAPALEGMSEYLPADGPPAERVASPDEISGWKSAVREAAVRFGQPPSGETATNVARGSLDAAVDGLESSVLAYEQAVGLPAGQRTAALERAASQRDLAVRVWSIGATQLDAINVESGNGHQHVYLPTTGVGGAFSADPAPEGTEAHDHAE